MPPIQYSLTRRTGRATSGNHAWRSVALTIALLLPLAGCASKRQVAADPPAPALSYLAVLDDGKITPLEGTVVLTVKPFPTAMFEEESETTITTGGKRMNASLRKTGRTGAAADGGMISIVTYYDHITMTGNLDTYAEDAQLYKGAKVTEVVDPYGAVRNLSVSLPGVSKGSSQDPYGYEVHNPQSEDWVLPKDGMHQGQVFNYTIPADPSKERSATAIQLVVRGRASITDGRSL